MADEPRSEGAGDYKRVWNAIAGTREHAYIMVDESRTEEDLVRRGGFAADHLVKGLGLSRDDVVLEIGCGVARIGREVAPRVKHWIGVDVAENMIAIARERLAGLPNVTLHAVGGADLKPLGAASVDKAYCHAVFIHMDKEDFYSYLREVRRVLVPGGLFYFDVWNLCSEAGWLRWELERAMYADKAARPVHRNQFSTPDEVRMFLVKAGLVPLAFFETYSVQVVASHPGPGVEPDAGWVELMRRRYAGSFEHMHWRKDNVDEFVTLVRKCLADRGRAPDGGPLAGSDPPTV
jgi:SAM-dependent methyltransferase